jgi:glycine cleavage system regulatory protein
MNLHERMESIADVYVAGGLSSDERREVDQHVAGCASCAALLRDAKEFSTWARGAIAPDAPPADLEDRVLARFRAAGQTKKRRFPVGKRVLKVTASIAAAVALVFLGNVFSLQQNVSGEVFRQELRQHSDSLKTYWSKMDGDTGVDVVSDGIDLDVRATGRPPAGNELAFFFKRDLGQEELGRARRWAYSPEDLRIDGATAELKDVNGLAKHRVDEKSKGETTTLAVGAGGGGGGRYGGRFGGKEGGAALAPEKLGEMANLGVNRGEDKQLAESLEKRQNIVARGGGTRAVDPTPIPVQDARKIIRTGDVSLEVESYEATYTKLNDLVAAEKGQIANSSTQKMANGKVRATVTIRILPERFEVFLAKLKEFGTIQNQTMGSQDVTKAYLDLETRLKSKEILAERLRKLLAEAKGTVKELMEVEVQLGNTNEAIEQIKGEVKYYDNQIGMSTITLRISEKDLGQPFEYVQTLGSNIALTAKDPDDAYARAQKEILDAGGQVVDSRMIRQSDGSSTGTVRGRVDSEKFPALREAIKKLGTVTNDTVNQQKTARGGNEGTPKADAPLRKEQAIVDVTIASPPLFVTRRSQILVETAEVESAYQNARRVVEAAGGKIVDGSLTGRADGMSATLKAQVDADKFSALVDSLKSAGKVKNANVNQVLPSVSSDGAAPLLRERAEIELALISPPQLIGEEHGIVKTVRDTFANSWTGLLWSIEKLFVGVSLAGPWLALAGAAYFLWRRVRRNRAAQPAPLK